MPYAKIPCPLPAYSIVKELQTDRLPDPAENTKKAPKDGIQPPSGAS